MNYFSGTGRSREKETSHDVNTRQDRAFLGKEIFVNERAHPFPFNHSNSPVAKHYHSVLMRDRELQIALVNFFGLEVPSAFTHKSTR